MASILSRPQWVKELRCVVLSQPFVWFLLRFEIWPKTTTECSTIPANVWSEHRCRGKGKKDYSDMENTVRSRYIAVIFLYIIHGKRPIAMGCRSWVHIWPTFHPCSCRAVYTIVSYITAIYGESLVAIKFTVFAILFQENVLDFVMHKPNFGRHIHSRGPYSSA